MNNNNNNLAQPVNLFDRLKEETTTIHLPEKVQYLEREGFKLYHTHSIPNNNSNSHPKISLSNLLHPMITTTPPTTTDRLLINPYASMSHDNNNNNNIDDDDDAEEENEEEGVGQEEEEEEEERHQEQQVDHDDREEHEYEEDNDDDDDDDIIIGEKLGITSKEYHRYHDNQIIPKYIAMSSPEIANIRKRNQALRESIDNNDMIHSTESLVSNRTTSIDGLKPFSTPASPIRHLSTTGRGGGGVDSMIGSISQISSPQKLLELASLCEER
jgi:hypothetical protein